MAELSNAEEAWIVAENELRATKKELADFRQEVREAIRADVDYQIANKAIPQYRANIVRFYIPAVEPDPLVDVLLEMDLSSDLEEGQHDAKWLRIKLDALGFEIRKKNDE